MPPRAPEGLNGLARQGRCRDASRFTQGPGSPFEKPRSNLRSAGLTRHSGVVSFGYFSLDKQRKVSRLSVREPTYKKPVTIVTHSKPQSPQPILHHQPRHSFKLPQIIANQNQTMATRMGSDMQIINTYWLADAFQRSAYAAVMHSSIFSVG